MSVPPHVATPPPLLPDPDAALAASVEQASTAVSVVAVSSAALQLDPSDLQILGAMLTSSCMCGTIASTSQNIGYTTSPFVALGPALVAVGNAALVVAFGAAHYAAVRCREACFDSPWSAPPREALGFPNWSVKCAMFLVPGVTKGAVEVLATLTSRTAAEMTAAVFGVAFVVAVHAAVEWVLYRGRVLRAPLRYDRLTYDRRVPRWVAASLPPQGAWSPKHLMPTCTFLVSNFSQAGKRF